MKSLSTFLNYKKLLKSSVAFVVSFCLFVSCFSFLVGILPVSAEGDIWGGQRDLSAPKDSDNDGIYEITKGSELAYIIKNGSAGHDYILTNDIYLNDISKVNWLTGLAEDGYTINPWYGNYESTAFSGSIDGNGYTVYGLYFNIGTSYGAYYNYTVGLIPAVTGTAEIKNLGVDKAFINYEGFASAFVGLGTAGSQVSFDSCYVGSDVNIKAYGVGAFRASSRDMTTNISNSYSLGNFNAQGGAYGMTSLVWGNLSITNSYNGNGPIISDTNDYQVTISDSYQTVLGGVNVGVETLSSDKMIGADVFTSADKMPNLNTNDKFTAAKDNYPYLKVFNKNPNVAPEPVLDVWGGQGDLLAPVDSDNDGVYEITKGSEFAYIIKNGAANKSYVLTNDIYLNDITKVNWKTGQAETGYTINQWYGNYESAAFSGAIDGNGYTVYGLFFNIGSSYGAYYDYTVGLIPNVDGTATITNLGVDSAFINYESFASAFVGRGAAGSTVNIDCCYVGSDVYIKAYGVGAFRSSTKDMTTNISNSYSLGTFNAQGGAYGLTSLVWGTLNISNCYNANGPILSDTNDYQVAISDSYQTISGGVNAGVDTISIDNMKGTDVFTSDDKMPNLNKNDKFVAVENDFPVHGTADDNDDNDNDDSGDQDDNSGIMTGPVDETVWGGQTDLSIPVDANGDGVYEISKASELAYIIKVGGEGKNYKLTADIYLNDTSKINWKNGSVEAGYTVNTWYDATNSADFKGSIDGAGHTVYGIYFKGSNSTFLNYVPYSIGLIPYVDSNTSVTVSNLGVDGVYIWYECYAAAFVGSVGKSGAPSAVVFENCYAGEHVNITAYSASAFRGYSYDGDTVIKNCYSFGNYTDKGGFNGLIGKVWGYTEIINSYNANGPIISDSERYKVSIKNSYQTVNGGAIDAEAYTIASENMQGEDALVNADKMPKLNEDSVYIATEAYPINYVFTEAYEDDSDSASNIWDGSVATELKGKGTQKDPYIITNGSELAFAIKSGGNGAYYKITEDIYLNDIEKVDWATGKASVIGYRINSWYSDVAFEGIIDGNGHVIYGLYYKTKEDDSKFFWGHYGVGLVPKVAEGKSVSISKLGIDNAYLSFECGTAAFVGYAGSGSKTKFDQCYVGENVVIRGNSVGALRGLPVESEIIVNNCYSLAEIACFGSNAVKGLIGNIWGKVAVRNSYIVNGPISASYERYNVIFEDCYQTEVGTDNEHGVTTILSNKMTGKNVFANMPALNTYKAFLATDDYPVLNIFFGGEGAISFTDEGVKGRVWSGKLATKFAGGAGTKADPYLIETPEQLAFLVCGGTGEEGKYYKLTADIKLNDTGKANWEETAKQWFAGMSIFRGVFDGNGHVVSGLYYNGEADSSAYAVGLFQRLGCDSIVMRVGVTQSKIYAKSKDGIALAAAIVGWAEDYNPNGNPNKEAPIIRECFADDTVFVEGTSAGGILGGAPTLVVVENCYFTGELTGKNFAGAIVADAWHGDGNGPIVKNCYAATLDRNAIGGGDAFRAKDVEAGITTITNVYVDGIDLSGAANLLSVMYMRGENAKQYLVGFDFVSVWDIVEGGSPVLRCFNNAEAYASTREPAMVTISFGNMGNLKFDAISGIPGYTPITDATIPTPYRYGFLFKGWHHFNEYGADFELTVFPEFDITLYAQWEEVGFSVGFENAFDAQYDYNSGIEIYKPGIANYDSDYIESGWTSLHTIKDSKIDPTFLLSYDNALEVGKEYHLVIWMATDDASSNGKIKLIHTQYPDVNDEILGSHTAFEYSDLSVGEWQKFEVKFVANAPYILISAPCGQSLYFDTAKIVPTGNSGELTKLDKPTTVMSVDPQKDDDKASASQTLKIIIIVIVAVVLVSGVAVVTVLVVRRKKK